ncbi:hypothetical protein KP509_09G026800 [Ceratopteris richardii]|uniref:Cyanovirin-N domain-containing protein n=1 Tax=Ceratopteris richardii TaxID=49495 RepID=A0A8T2U181_CERRI|nr:hypothetical protein KP509_09G026800 [Ceratopteris richardii]
MARADIFFVSFEIICGRRVRTARFASRSVVGRGRAQYEIMKNTRAPSSRNAPCFCMLLLLHIGGNHFVRPCAAKCHFEDGSFSHTCGDIMLVPDNLVRLQADCFATGNPESEIYRSTLGLNMNIENNNGRLQCRVCMASPLVPRHCNFYHSC